MIVVMTKAVSDTRVVVRTEAKFLWGLYLYRHLIREIGRCIERSS